jgi:hypothetical protein
MRKWSLRAAIGVGLIAVPLALWAQTVVIQNLTGNEIVRAELGPGGTEFYTTVNALRNATGYIIVPTGTTVNTTVPTNAAKAMASGAITTWNVKLPTAPYDGQTVAITCPGGTSTVAVTATSPTGVAIVGTAFTSCTSGGSAANGAEFIYALTPNTWYRIQ